MFASSIDLLKLEIAPDNRFVSDGWAEEGHIVANEHEQQFDEKKPDRVQGDAA